MKKIRKGTFETNSSSMHSLVVEGGIKGKKRKQICHFILMELLKSKQGNMVGDMVF